MEIGLADNIKIETEVPILKVISFRFSWEPNEHALLILDGYINNDVEFNQNQLSGTSVKIWLGAAGNSSNVILFNGAITRLLKKSAGKVVTFHMVAKSGSIHLDFQIKRKSFQNVKETYAGVIRQLVRENGGNVICTSGTDRMMNMPVIQYEETTWAFIKRLASHLGTWVVADIETGKPNVWFGLPKGDKIPSFLENEYTVYIQGGAQGGDNTISYEMESRQFYKIGDSTTCFGREMTVFSVLGNYEKGELVFRYVMKNQLSSPMIYQQAFTGLGLKGIIKDVHEDQIKIALDIDDGIPTGDYYYNWYPETGNSLYAMPEKGAHVVLMFCSADERSAYAVHALANRPEEALCYQDRSLESIEGNSVCLYTGIIRLARGGKHSLTLGDGSVSARTSRNVRIVANGKIKLKAKRIVLDTPDELNIYQG